MNTWVRRHIHLILCIFCMFCIMLSLSIAWHDIQYHKQITEEMRGQITEIQQMLQEK